MSMSSPGGNFSCAYPVIQRLDLSIGQQLGCGSFGSVYYAIWKSRNMTVALKKVFMLEKEVRPFTRQTGSSCHRVVVGGNLV
jgi:hypothetical protein